MTNVLPTSTRTGVTRRCTCRLEGARTRAGGCRRRGLGRGAHEPLINRTLSASACVMPRETSAFRSPASVDGVHPLRARPRGHGAIAEGGGEHDEAGRGGCRSRGKTGIRIPRVSTYLRVRVRLPYNSPTRRFSLRFMRLPAFLSHFQRMRPFSSIYGDSTNETPCSSRLQERIY